MAPGAESVPFAFVAEAERYQSNVTPPARERRSVRAVLGGVLITLLVVAALTTAVLLGMSALSSPTT
ncbi:hypothetical protein [Saccharothrix sp. ST-888]|uniref:hypothetical protein n=1 Tax=Saccharothrix sp. ST-888 TaxID=1427391 RepID=UPI0005ECE49D|nr:hypothetical protein [Saccharothrix sp. ST-888]KJK55041.1 hypothetical protein UK12_31115 [Saccharothrix sp. ST-888]